MNIHYLQHVPFEDAGHIITWARDRGHHISRTKLYENEPLPQIDNYDWFIIMGGPMGVHDSGIYPWLKAETNFIRQCLESEKPLWGICLGAQLIAHALGAKVYPSCQKEIGWFPVEATPHGNEWGLPTSVEAFHWHGDTFEIPAGAAHLATSEACPHQAFAWREHVIGLQFHLEATENTIQGLLEHCADEMGQGPYVSSCENILAQNECIHNAVKVLENLLCNWEKRLKLRCYP